jgi:hypothetical protein
MTPLNDQINCVQISFRISQSEMEHLRTIAREGGFRTPSLLVQSIVKSVIEDDARAHGLQATG